MWCQRKHSRLILIEERLYRENRGLSEVLFTSSVWLTSFRQWSNSFDYVWQQKFRPSSCLRRVWTQSVDSQSTHLLVIYNWKSSDSSSFVGRAGASETLDFCNQNFPVQIQINWSRRDQMFSSRLLIRLCFYLVPTQKTHKLCKHRKKLCHIETCANDQTFAPK